MKKERLRKEILLGALTAVLIAGTAEPAIQRGLSAVVLAADEKSEGKARRIYPRADFFLRKIPAWPGFYLWSRVHSTEVLQETNTETEIENTETEEEISIPKEINEIIFVGDSRVVGMASVGGFYYIGKESMGYSWLTSEAIYSVQDAMANYPEASVVFCFGVNDLGNVWSYIDFYQSLLWQYPDRDIWFLSVNPVNDAQAASCGYQVNNGMITPFNDAMRSAFPDRFIDCYGYLMSNGFNCADGVHYDPWTYSMIQEYVRMVVNRWIDPDDFSEY